MADNLSMRAARYFGVQDRPRTSVVLGSRAAAIFKGQRGGAQILFYAENPRHGFTVHLTAQRRAELLAALASPRTDPSDDQLDGVACTVCGGGFEPMVPAGCGPRGQLFRHEQCPSSDQTKEDR